MDGTIVMGEQWYYVSDLIDATKNQKPQLVCINELVNNLHVCAWDDNLKPIDIIRRNRTDAVADEHLGRIENADLQYPIIIDANKIVYDGYHRLCKYYMEFDEYVRVVIISDDDLFNLAKPLKPNFWND